LKAEEIIVRINNGISKFKNRHEFKKGNLSLNKYHLRVNVNDNDKEIPLTLIEYKLLLFIIENDGKIASREETIKYVWGKELISKNVLNTHLFNLKQKLEEWNFEIKSIRFKGIVINSK
jgi:DNA-binding response OmpR family regulator